MIQLEDALRQTLANPPVDAAESADPMADIRRRIARRRRRIVGTVTAAVLAVVAGITVPLSLPSTDDRPAHAPAEPKPPTSVVTVAEQMAVESRKGPPTQVRWVRTTADEVPRIPRIDQRGLDDIYLIEVSGQFALPRRCPSFAHPYQCESLYPVQLTVIPVDGPAADAGNALRMKPYDLAQFGDVQSFTLRDVPRIPERIAAAATDLDKLRQDSGRTTVEWVETTEREWRKSAATHPDRRIYIVQLYGRFENGDPVATTAIAVSGDPGAYKIGTRATPRELREIGAVHTFTIR